MVKLNIGCGKVLKPAEEGWLNLDKIQAEPGVLKFDAFRYPWDLKDNIADEFFLSHIVEHIPHETRMNPEVVATGEWAVGRWRELEDLDGFFAFFAEVWRVGIDGAKVSIAVPHAYTHGAMQDPTHTRYIVPQTFTYLSEHSRGDTNNNFDYKLPFMFRIKSIVMDVLKTDEEQAGELKDEIAQGILHHWDATQTIYVELEVMKSDSEPPSS